MIRLMASLALLSLVSAQETTSAVTGVVRFTGTHKPRLMNRQVDAMKHGVPPRGDKDVFDEDVILGEKGELANVLVRVKGPVKGEFRAPAEIVEVDAAGYFFKPRVVALQVGQTLRLKNSALTNVNYRVRAQRNRELNQGMARGSSKDVVLDRPETAIQVQHQCCPWQIAWVHVIEHPFFAVTGADGMFQIKGLPAGTYEIEAWHEKFGVRTVTVTVDGKGALAHDFAFDGK